MTTLILMAVSFLAGMWVQYFREVAAQEE